MKINGVPRDKFASHRKPLPNGTVKGSGKDGDKGGALCIGILLTVLWTLAAATPCPARAARTGRFTDRPSLMSGRPGPRRVPRGGGRAITR